MLSSIWEDFSSLIELFFKKFMSNEIIMNFETKSQSFSLRLTNSNYNVSIFCSCSTAPTRDYDFTIYLANINEPKTVHITIPKDYRGSMGFKNLMTKDNFDKYLFDEYFIMAVFVFHMLWTNSAQSRHTKPWSPSYSESTFITPLLAYYQNYQKKFHTKCSLRPRFTSLQLIINTKGNDFCRS
jgi:hypothetical protein